MITTSDSYNTIETKKFFVILPYKGIQLNKFLKKYKAKKNKKAFSYNSKNNQQYLTISQLKKIISLQKKINDL